MDAQPKLTPTMHWALEWFVHEGGAERRTWCAAGISATTVNALRERKLVEWFEAPFGGFKYAATEAGRKALEQS